jgi:hypothetical protein
MLVVFGLAGQTEPDTGNRLATRFWDLASAFLTVREAFTHWQLAASALDGIFDRGIDLFLHRAVFCESAGHFAFPRSLADGTIVGEIDAHVTSSR